MRVVTNTKGLLSQRLSQLAPSMTAMLNGKVAALRAQGIAVISFGQGEPDFAVPQAVKQAGIAAIEQNQTKYTPVGGHAALRAAIATRLTDETGLPFTPEQVATTTGAKEALFLALLALCDPGDEVIVPVPYWLSYIDQVRLVGATPVLIETTLETGFKVRPEQLEAALSVRTKAIVLNSPANPTGVVYGAAELRALADVLTRSAAAVISDEIYDGIVYGPYTRWLHVAPDLAERTLVVNGVSKSFAMGGWRLGYIAGPTELVDALKNIQSHTTTHPSSVAQAAALAAYTNDAGVANELAAMVRAFQARRDALLAALNAIHGVHCHVPDGAFYAFPDVRGLLNRTLASGVRCADDDALAAYLLDAAHIGVAPGSVFGAPGFLRFSFAASMEQLSTGMERFAAAVRL